MNRNRMNDEGAFGFECALFEGYDYKRTHSHFDYDLNISTCAVAFFNGLRLSIAHHPYHFSTEIEFEHRKRD